MKFLRTGDLFTIFTKEMNLSLRFDHLGLHKMIFDYNFCLRILTKSYKFESI